MSAIEVKRIGEAVRFLTRGHWFRQTRRFRKRSAASDFRATRGWGWDENILGLSAGWKFTNGRLVKGQPALTVYVRKKWRNGNLTPAQRIPERIALDYFGREIVTDVVPLPGACRAHNGMIRPVQAGIEVAHRTGPAGTLCAVVNWIGHEGKFGLGCSHVLAKGGRSVRPGEEIEQPFSFADPPELVIGNLTAEFSRIKVDGEENRSDHALISLPKDARPGVFGPGVLLTGVSELQPDQMASRHARLFGARTTGTRSRILGVESSMRVEFRFGVGVMVGLVAYESRCREGDSGGPVVDDSSNKLLGMHVAGIPDERFGLFLPLRKLFDDLGLSLLK